jgi:hypothetical protein
MRFGPCVTHQDFGKSVAHFVAKLVIERSRGCKSSLSQYAQTLEFALDVLPSDLPKMIRQKRSRAAPNKTSAAAKRPL